MLGSGQSHSWLSFSAFWSMRDLMRLRRLLALQARAQITQRSRVDELAHQRGKQSCSRGGSPKGEHRCGAPRARRALAPRRSRVQFTRATCQHNTKMSRQSHSWLSFSAFRSGIVLIKDSDWRSAADLYQDKHTPRCHFVFLFIKILA